MKKVVLIAAVVALALLVNAPTASARGRGGCGGCSSSCGGCGYSCGYSCGSGCCSGGYGGYSGCSSCGYSAGYSGGSSCAGGVCIVTGAGSYAVAAASQPTGATVVVNLPEDAKLTIDGEATTSTSASRTFQTPALPDGKEYHYTLKAEVVRDGKVQTTTRQVTVRAGQTTQVELTVSAPTVAAQ